MTSLPIDQQFNAGKDPDAPSMKTYPRWPVLVLAASAFVAIWGGWVSLGRMCGFGPVNLLPGITDFQVDLSITLPLGMEVYAAYATGAWLSNRRIDHGTRMFAKWSSLCALFIGGAGQVTYHLLNAAHVEHAPTAVVSVVSCIPVVVLGMASQLAYRLTKHSKVQPQAVVEAAEDSRADETSRPVGFSRAAGPASAAPGAADPAPQTDLDVAPEAVVKAEDEAADAASTASVEAESPDDEATAELDVQPEEGVEHTLQLDMEPHIGSMFYDQAVDMAASDAVAPASSYGMDPYGAASDETASHEMGSYESASYEPTEDIWSQIDFGESASDSARSQYLHPDQPEGVESDGTGEVPAGSYQDEQSDEQGAARDGSQEEDEDAGADNEQSGRSTHRGGRSRGPLSDEEKERILELVGDGHSEREVSRKVGRSRATVHRVVTSEQQQDDEQESQDEELELASAS